uniref:Ribonuclease BN n=1 Tax=Lygus hesperus TaxID=30085 RepID=A0A0A9YQU2_LYGHE
MCDVFPNFVQGKKFAVLQDTGQLDPNPRDRKLLENCFVMIHECTYDNSMKCEAQRSRHSYPDIVARLANSLQVQNLILTHFSTRYRRERFIFTDRDLDPLASKNDEAVYIPVLPNGKQLAVSYAPPFESDTVPFSPRIKGKFGGYIFIAEDVLESTTTTDGGVSKQIALNAVAGAVGDVVHSTTVPTDTVVSMDHGTSADTIAYTDTVVSPDWVDPIDVHTVPVVG